MIGSRLFFFFRAVSWEISFVFTIQINSGKKNEWARKALLESMEALRGPQQPLTVERCGQGDLGSGAEPAGWVPKRVQASVGRVQASVGRIKSLSAFTWLLLEVNFDSSMQKQYRALESEILDRLPALPPQTNVFSGKAMTSLGPVSPSAKWAL